MSPSRRSTEVAAPSQTLPRKRGRERTESVA
jgi:hypothetical protein